MFRVPLPLITFLTLLCQLSSLVLLQRQLVKSNGTIFFLSIIPNATKILLNIRRMRLIRPQIINTIFETARFFEKKFQMDLIIGLDERRTEFIQRKLSRHYSTINVLTHDELIAMVEDYYKRLRYLHALIKS